VAEPHRQRQRNRRPCATAAPHDPDVLCLRGQAGWSELFPLFEPLPGARQIFDLGVELVQTSCGMAVPRYAYKGGRQDLSRWAAKKGMEGLARYWKRKNRRSLDGLPAPIPAADEGTGN
jgi:hypothetical protein